ncbi:MAG: murein biosynthesis integral membrane protein MurJ, partial [Spirochaetaceae bacterium]|nr:murein biosynthesis integral membrane protein MurJ [Spirochaetaceae bacterium]
TLASRILGLLREMTKASLLGTSALSDAFSVAFMIPNLFRRLFAEGSIAAAFIPTFKDYLVPAPSPDGTSLEGASMEGTNREAIRRFLSSFFTVLSFFVSITVGAGILLSPQIVPIFGMEALDETIFLTRLMFPFLAFVSLAAFFQGILNSVHVFAPPGFAPVLLNLATILCAYALKDHTGNPARAMATGILLGGFLEAAIQFPFVIKRGFRFSFTGLRGALKNPGARKVLRLIGPTIIGMAAYQLNDLVSTALAGNAGAGVVSSLQYSLRLQELILGIFAVSIGTVLLPDLAEDAKACRWERYQDRLISAMDIIALITIPISFFSLTQGELLIRLIFQNRSFDETSVALTYGAFRFHIPGLFFIALNRILAPAFYAQSDSKSPTLAGIISFGVNMLLAALLAGPFRGSGIALALSAASAVNTILLLLFLKRNPRIVLGKVLSSALAYTAKLVILSIIATIPVFWLSRRLGPLFAGRGRLIAYGVPFGIAALTYIALGLGLLLITRDRHIRIIAGIFRRTRKNTGGQKGS